MSTRRRDIISLYNCFFITTTFNDWLHLFLNHKYYLIVINSIIFCLKKYNAEIIAYVLMPNHIHLILFYNEKADISGFMRDLKKYTSTRIRQMLEKDGKDITVKKLRYNKFGQKFKIWKNRFDAIIIRNRKRRFIADKTCLGQNIIYNASRT
jgi:putative transposase